MNLARWPPGVSEDSTAPTGKLVVVLSVFHKIFNTVDTALLYLQSDVGVEQDGVGLSLYKDVRLSKERQRHNLFIYLENKNKHDWVDV